MEAANLTTAYTRLASLGASSGFDLTPAREAWQSSRLNQLDPLASDARPLPRMNLLFSQSLLDRFECSHPQSVTHHMSDFFSRLGGLCETVNTHGLADCRFYYYDQQQGDVHALSLTDLKPVHAQAEHFKGESLGVDRSPAQVDVLMESVYSNLSRMQSLAHPDLLISDCPEEVKTAQHQGTPAVLARCPDPALQRHIPNQQGEESETIESKTSDAVSAKCTEHDLKNFKPLMVALDFDCTLFGAAGEWLFAQGLSHLSQSEREKMYHRFEQLRGNTSLGPGPMLHFVQALVGLKKLLSRLPTPLDNQLRFAIITARGHQARERVFTNLATCLPEYSTFLTREHAPYFMNGAPKLPKLLELDTDFFLDDSGTHTRHAHEYLPTGQILWGPGHYNGEQEFHLHPALLEHSASSPSAFKPRVHLLPHAQSTVVDAADYKSQSSVTRSGSL